jgi:tape measure domain-containing protein
MSEKKVEYILSLKDLFSSKIKAATPSTERLNNVVNNTQKSFSGLGAALGIGLGVGGVVSFGKAVVDSLSNYEYFSASLRTLMKGDAGAAKALETQLVKTAATTPFSLTEIQDATKQLMAYGFAGGEVVGNIKMLGDVASALKIPFQDIAYLYGTLKTQGRAYQRDILQFQQRGIPVVEQLAKQFGVSKSAITQMVSEGKIGFAEVEKAFKSMTGEGGIFFNMMAEQSKTVGGQISNLGDNWEQLKVNIGKSQRGIISGTITFLNTLVSNFTNYFKTMNDLEESFNKFGASQFTLGEKLNQFFLASVSGGAIREMQVFSDALDKNYGGELSAQKALENQTKLRNLIVNNYDAMKKGEITALEYMRKRAAILGMINKISFGQSLKSQTGTVEQATADLTKDKNQSITSVEARQPQIFNIDINKLVEKVEITQNNIKDSADQIKEAVTKALIEAVNDFQIMATK